MGKFMKNTMTLALCGIFALAGCGDDEKSTPMAAEEDAASNITPEAVQLMGVLVTSFQAVFFASLDPSITSMPGAGGGSVEIAPGVWTLQDFSPDGNLLLNGALNVAADMFPNIPVTGTVEMSGSQAGTIEIDMLVSVNGTELASTGTVTIDGTEFDIAELTAAASAAAEAAAAEGG